MPFWKKPEDPWDMDPAKAREKRERQEREPIENPLNALKDWNAERKARAAAKQAELEAQPKEVCPWCGREMERGYIQGGRDRVTWTPGFLTTKSAWLGPTSKDRLPVDDEGGFFRYKTAWYCRECERMVFHQAPEEGFSSYPQELDEYFRDAKGEGEEEEPS